MLTLEGMIADQTPKMNKMMVEGFCYHRIEGALEYIDAFIRHTRTDKTATNLKYQGARALSPKEELQFVFGKQTKPVYDMAENDIFLCEFLFQYGDEPEPRSYYAYLPFLTKGNTIQLSGNTFLVSPTLSDKVISVGELIIFINILTAKYSFTRQYFTIVCDGGYVRVPLITTVLYKNQAKKLEDTTRAKMLVLHYLLANAGYSETMKTLLGFVPKATYDGSNDPNMVVYESTGNPPHGYIKDRSVYPPTKIKFVVPRDQASENVRFVMGNLFYLLDNFPSVLEIDLLDHAGVWKRLLGEIIHSGNHGLAYISEKIDAHFNDLNSRLDVVTIRKLNDIGVHATTLMELLVVIFQNFNPWIMRHSVTSLYHNKSFEAESILLSPITSRITKIFLDLRKEELRLNGAPLPSEAVDKIMHDHRAVRAIFRLKKLGLCVSTLEHSGDSLYFKRTSVVSYQESDFTNVAKGETNTSERTPLQGSMATVGSVLFLSKRNPNPLLRLNPYVNVDAESGTVLPTPGTEEMIADADRYLSNMVSVEAGTLIDPADLDVDDAFAEEDDIEDDGANIDIDD